MAFLPLRPVPLPAQTEALYDEWLGAIDEALDDPAVDRNDLCREILEDLYGVAGEDGRPPAPGRRLPRTGDILRAQLDPRNVALEPEFYHETAPDRYARVKPLLWLWEMFDRSPVGENVPLGIRFRRLLARRIFRSCGRNFKAFPHVRLTFGYNLDVGDDVVVHRHVLLDDRGGIELHDGCSISDFANIYSHTHDLVDGREVRNRPTVLERGVRVTYHATILAGTRVGLDAMVGAGAILTRDAQPRGVYIGVPARLAKQKDGAALEQRAPATPDPLRDEPAPLRNEDAGE
jgi:acetyltransferase-like isoleucine patch superfamily enzyme